MKRASIGSEDKAKGKKTFDDTAFNLMSFNNNGIGKQNSVASIQSNGKAFQQINTIQNQAE